MTPFGYNTEIHDKDQISKKLKTKKLFKKAGRGPKIPNIDFRLPLHENSKLNSIQKLIPLCSKKPWSSSG